MPFPLHKSPVGLLELFRLRTLGSAPPAFGEQVTPTIDCTEFYSAQNKLILNGVAVTGALALVDDVTLVAPARVHSMGIIYIGSAATPAADIMLSLELLQVVGGVLATTPIANYFYVPNGASLVGSQYLPWGIRLPVPWVLQPQTVIRARASSSVPGAGVDHSLQCSLFIDEISGQT